MKTTHVAGCIILDEENRLLLIHRRTLALTQWEIPGGKLEGNESVRAAAEREVEEELGLNVELDRELGHAEFSEGEDHYVYTWFLAHIVGGEPDVKESDKHDEHRYFSWSELRSRHDLSASTQNFLRHFPTPPHR